MTTTTLRLPDGSPLPPPDPDVRVYVRCKWTSQHNFNEQSPIAQKMLMSAFLNGDVYAYSTVIRNMQRLAEDGRTLTVEEAEDLLAEALQDPLFEIELRPRRKKGGAVDEARP